MTRVSLKRTSESIVPLVSFISGKGGVGKSVLAANVAREMSSRGLRTLLVDFDLHCGCQHILLNQIAKAGLPDVLAGKADIHEVLLHLSPTLSLIPSTVPLADAHRREAGEQTVTLIESISSRYDFVLFDHPSGMSLSSLLVAELSRLNVLVAVPDMMSLSDAFGLCKHLSLRKTSGTIALLVNRCFDDSEATDISDKFQDLSLRFIKRTPELIGFVRESSDVRQSVASQQPIVDFAPNSEAALSIIEMANQVIDLTTASTLALHMGVGSHGNEIHKTPAAADIKD